MQRNVLPMTSFVYIRCSAVSLGWGCGRRIGIFFVNLGDFVVDKLKRRFGEH